MSRPAIVPELYVSDLATSLAFYCELLGFSVAYERPEERFVALRLGDARLMLEEAPGLDRATPTELEAGQWRTAPLERPFGRGMNLEIAVSDVATPAARLVAAGVGFVREPHEKTYRVSEGSRSVRQFVVADPDGYLIRFSQPIDQT